MNGAPPFSSVWPSLLLTGLLAAANMVAQAEVRLATTTPLTESNPVTPWVHVLERELEPHWPLRVYPAGVLGSELERSEAVALGLLHINVSSGRDVLHYSEALRAVRLPFLIANPAQLACLMRRTDFLAQVNRATSPRGVRVLDIVFSGAMTGVFSQTGPADSLKALQALRLRGMDRIQLLSLKAWGASPVQVAWGEVHSALQTGIVEGYLNPPGIALRFGHTRELKHFLDLRVFAGVRFVTVSERWYRGLEPRERERLGAAVARAGAENLVFVQRQAARELASLQAEGVKVTRPSAELLAELRDRSRRMFHRVLSEGALQVTQDHLAAACGSTGAVR